MNKELILNYIGTVAGKYIFLNIALHIACYAAIILLLLPKFRHKRVVWNSVTAGLFTSVAVIAILNGNPFNFGIFAIAAGFAVWELIKGRNVVETLFSPAYTLRMNIRNAVLLAVSLFGLVYPHFVDAHPALMPLLSPIGIIPCPTLTFVLGIANIIYPKVNRPLYTALAVLGAFYGVTGVFMVNVYIDIPLMAVGILSVYNLALFFRKKPAVA